MLDQEATDVVARSSSSIPWVTVGATARPLRKAVTSCLIQVNPLLERFMDFSAVAHGDQVCGHHAGFGVREELSTSRVLASVATPIGHRR